MIQDSIIENTKEKIEETFSRNSLEQQEQHQEHQNVKNNSNSNNNNTITPTNSIKQIKIGNYLLGETIGKGNSAVVKKATHFFTRQKVI